jgi:hypothetical protein
MFMKFKFSAVCLLILLAQTWTMAFGSPKEYSKVIIKEFPISVDQTVGIYNKYGKVNVEAWDEDAVKIKIEIVVDAQSEEEAEEVYNRIRFAFSEEGDGVNCSTEVEPSNKGFWSWFGKDGNSDFSINYDVKMPAAAGLLVSNKYGDCSVQNLTGACDFNIKYGNLHCYGAPLAIKLDLAYGKGKIEEVVALSADLVYSNLKCMSAETCEINSKYCNVTIGDAGDVICNTKYDDYNLGRISTLKNNGKYDDFVIDQVSDISMMTTYADLEINTLHHFADLDFRYGEVDIKNVNDNFRKIELSGNYADFKINTENVQFFDLDINGNYVDVDCNRKIHVIEEDKEGTRQTLTGYVERRDAGGDIIANLTYGSVKIR